MAVNIWQLQSRGDVEGIIQALETPDPVVRRRAVAALGALGATTAVPKLKILYESEVNHEIRALIASTLKTLESGATASDNSDARQRDELLRQLHSPKQDEVALAIIGLGKLGDRTVVEHLVILFREASYPPKLRLLAAEALLQLESAPASASLLGALRKNDWQVRRNAAAILGQLKADWAVEPLIDAARHDPHPTVRKTAAAALRHIKTPEALAALQELKLD